MIKNEIAQNAIDDCRTELDKIWHMIEAVGSTNKISGYLTRYALVRICGTLEISYKTIIADYYVQQSPLLDRFITRHVRDANRNPNYNNICNTLKEFDEEKCKLFKQTISSLKNAEDFKSSLDTINTSRNAIAHGASSSLSFNDLKVHFEKALQIIEVLDSLFYTSHNPKCPHTKALV